MKIAIVGTGMIGRAWAVSFARGEAAVVLWNRDGGRARDALAAVSSTLPALQSADLLNGLTAAEIRDRIEIADDLATALDGADYVQENVAESVDVKRALYATMERHVPPDCILASSTSGLLPSTFTGHLGRPGNCIVAHPLNPPYLIPAVDVVPSPATTPDTVRRTAELLERCGQAPLIHTREDSGFLTIRIQGAIYQEAWRLVAEGLASTEDVDRTVREGLALRWSFIGPFETADLNAPGGVRDFVGRYGALYRDLAYEGPPVAWAGELLDRVERERREKLPMADHRARQAWRDGRLMRLAAHKRAAARDDEASGE